MEFSKYINYTHEDFFNDDDFLRFVIEQKDSDMLAWKKFQEENPNRGKIAAFAFETIALYRQQQVFTNEAAQSEVFEKITATISLGETKVKRFNRPIFFKVAAAFAVVILSGLLYFSYWNKESVKTDYGNIERLTLPDGSEVVLNGNSKISYAPNFENGPREVWLDGEALFKVRHINIDTNKIKPEEKFVVHCDDMDIEVLGTTFNVKSRHDKTAVGLLTGKVRIDYSGVSNKQQQIVLVPGDLVKHSTKAKIVRQKITNPQQLTAWTSRQLMFQDATLEEMMAVLQDDLGYEVTLSDDRLNHLKLEGEINVNSVKELLHILSKTLHITIKTNNKNITITE